MTISDTIAPVQSLGPELPWYGPIQGRAQVFVHGPAIANAVLRSAFTATAGRNGLWVGPVKNIGPNVFRISFGGLVMGNVAALFVEQEDQGLPGLPSPTPGLFPAAFDFGGAGARSYGAGLALMQFGSDLSIGTVAAGAPGINMNAGDTWDQLVFVPAGERFQLAGTAINQALEFWVRVVEPREYHGRTTGV